MIDEKRNIALVEEEVTVGKQLTPGATVMVSVRADTQLRRLELPVTTEQISVDTVEIDREVTAVPEIRTEGEVTIIPVVEEEAVLMKRLILKREVRVTKKRTETVVSKDIPLRSERALIERLPGAPETREENIDE